MSTTNAIYEPGHVWPHIRDLTLHLNRNVISHHLQPEDDWNLAEQLPNSCGWIPDFRTFIQKVKQDLRNEADGCNNHKYFCEVLDKRAGDL